MLRGSYESVDMRLQRHLEGDGDGDPLANSTAVYIVLVPLILFVVWFFYRWEDNKPRCLRSVAENKIRDEDRTRTNERIAELSSA